MESKACPGKLYVHRDQWTIPNGKTARECTYCEWCVNNGCFQLEPGFSVSRDLGTCSCDCPVRDAHVTMQPYNCGQHDGTPGMTVMGTCKSCWRAASTSSSAEKYCGGCSAQHGICIVCGVNRDGKYPMRPVAKMLSRENGRGRDACDDLM